MEPESKPLSEMSQREKEKYGTTSRTQKTLQVKNPELMETETGGCQRRGVGGWGKRVKEVKRDKLPVIKEIKINAPWEHNTDPLITRLKASLARSHPILSSAMD